MSEDRLAALEQRVAALERSALERSHRVAASAPSPASAPAEPGAEFWALEGLRARVAEPGAVLFTGAVQLPDGGEVRWQHTAPAAELLAGDWAEVADALSALAHPVRLLLLHHVLTGTRTAAELTAVEGLGTSGQLYHHLRQLVTAGWLRSAGRGRYEVPAVRVVPLLVTLAAARR